MVPGSQKSELTLQTKNFQHLDELCASSLNKYKNHGSYFLNGNIKSHRLFMEIISLGYQSPPDV